MYPQLCTCVLSAIPFRYHSIQSAVLPPSFRWCLCLVPVTWLTITPPVRTSEPRFQWPMRVKWIRSVETSYRTRTGFIKILIKSKTVFLSLWHNCLFNINLWNINNCSFEMKLSETCLFKLLWVNLNSHF